MAADRLGHDHLYLAALAGVDSQLYEAARVDGAGRCRQFWHITLPAIRPAAAACSTS